MLGIGPLVQQQQMREANLKTLRASSNSLLNFCCSWIAYYRRINYNVLFHKKKQESMINLKETGEIKCVPYHSSHDHITVIKMQGPSRGKFLASCWIVQAVRADWYQEDGLLMYLLLIQQKSQGKSQRAPFSLSTACLWMKRPGEHSSTKRMYFTFSTWVLVLRRPHTSSLLWSRVGH